MAPPCTPQVHLLPKGRVHLGRLHAVQAQASAKPIPRGSSSSSTPSTDRSSASSFIVQHATPLEYWAAADVHCRVFLEERRSHRQSAALHTPSTPSSSAPDRASTQPGPSRRSSSSSSSFISRFVPKLLPSLPEELHVVRPLLDRVDRVACLQALESHARQGFGNGVLLLAYEHPDELPAASTSQQQSQQLQQQQRQQGHPLDLPGSVSTFSSSSNHRPSFSNTSNTNSNYDTATGLCGVTGRTVSYAVVRPPPDELTQQVKSLVQQAQSNPVYSLMLAILLGGHPGTGLGVGSEEVRLLGVAYVDSFGDLVPARATRGGGSWRRRTGIAYISNVAVLPSARGRGIARRLVDEAESLARNWGCRAVGLHCNQKNTPAVQLYRSMGYRRTVLEPAIMPYLHGRAPDRCHFLLKRLSKVQAPKQQA